MNPRRIVILAIVIAITVVITILARLQDTTRTSPAVPPAGPSAPAPGQGSAPPTTPSPNQSSAVPPKPSAAVPSFDIARVEPDGQTLVAGRAEPGADVELLANGNVVDRTKANDAGEFVMSPPPLASGSHELTLRAAGTLSAKSVAVSVPNHPGGEVLVVAGEAGKPSQVLQSGSTKPDAATDLENRVASLDEAKQQAATPAAAPQLRIEAVEAENGRLFVQGSGPADGRARIYLNGQVLAEATIGKDNRWSLTVEQGLDAGNYAIRADQVDDKGEVIARSEVPFATGPIASAALAAASSQASTQTAPSGVTAETAATEAASANPVVKALETFEVKRGDNLWRISRQTYGYGVRYSSIYEANSGQIRDPNRIYPGQIFVMPPRS
ncbi:LysM peptidoglycan-binding domain-containing protein [Terrihabitans sp. B22-R8]|uniref:LysM peptidoglycan-binding domain-containing protein n=1 Tax=Terrihabitans sp. B22-R8 TaxID=3425128 RepID=UPI00403C1F45